MLIRNGKPAADTISHPDLTAINADFKNGKLTYEQAVKAVRDIKARLLDKRDEEIPIVVFHADNSADLARFWKEHYVNKTIIDPAKAHSEFRRALVVIGNLSLRTAEHDELCKVLQKAFGTDPRAYRRLADRLNCLLRFVGRDFQLARPAMVIPEPRYLTLNELRQVLPHFANDNTRTLAWVSWGTGARWGEVFAFQADEVRPDGSAVFVSGQVRIKDNSTKRTRTKNKKRHWAFVIPEAREHLLKWMRLPEKIRMEMKNLQPSKLMHAACRKAFPGVSNKDCTWHDLRHSYCIHLINKGVGLSQIASYVGDSLSCVEMYYAGKVVTDEGLDLTEQIVSKSKKKDAT